MQYLTFPWEQAGRLLRGLSLSGPAGNAVAWTLFLTIGALPLAAGFLLWITHRARRADLLLAALSAALYTSLWFFVNPSYMDVYLSPLPTGGFAKYILASLTDSLLLTWFLLRFITGYEKAERGKLLQCLQFLLYLYVALLAVALLRNGIGEFLERSQSLTENNTAPGQRHLTVSIFFLGLQIFVNLLPRIAQLPLLLLVGSFLGSCRKAAFGPEGGLKMERLKKYSGHLLILILTVNLGFNVLQFLLSGILLDTHHRILFPLQEIIVVLGIRTLSFLYLESRRLKEENDMII